MSFVRPDARAALMRWREVLIGALVAGLGLYWALAAHGLLPYLGYLLLACGAVLAVVGFQRARFRNGGGGPGLVQVDEGQITYFGPLSGGSVALADLQRLDLDQTGRPAHWVLSQPGQPPLHVPLNAEGTDALFDAFAALPGIRTEHMLAQLKDGGRKPVLIWQRPGSGPQKRLT